ncbi:MAG: carbon-nitrogen hydrolase family protein [Acidimicrobiales bacterium]
MTADQLTVAVAQTISVPGAVEENARRSALLVERYLEKGVRLMVFPELSLVDYELNQFDDPAVWVTDDDPRLDPLRERCRESSVWAVVGAGVRTGDGRRLLAALVVDADGGVTVHGKENLHGLEREVFEAPGQPQPLVDIAGWPAAVAVCYDAAVPAHAQAAADAGAELYIVSSWYDAHEFDRMNIHLAARAMDHRMYVLGANYARAALRDTCGGSGTWGPDGVCELRAGFSVQVMVADLDHARLAELRSVDQALT